MCVALVSDGSARRRWIPQSLEMPICTPILSAAICPSTLLPHLKPSTCCIHPFCLQKNTHQIIKSSTAAFTSILHQVCNQQAVTGIWYGKVMSYVPPTCHLCVTLLPLVGWLERCLRGGLARWDEVCGAMVPWCSSRSRQTRAGAMAVQRVLGNSQQMATGKPMGLEKPRNSYKKPVEFVWICRSKPHM